ncbi:hypothetical protein D3Z45_15820 [Lachnospiraceae bacterium]|nr:hypothetical protein [Lachnospiraceae bacterium]
MHNLDNVVKCYFSTVSVNDILRETIRYDCFPEHDFLQLSKAYMRQYSDTENSQLYKYIEKSAWEEGHPFSSMKDRSGLNVFAALEELSERLLITENNETLCIYGNLLRFRSVTNYVEEDLLICAYYAMRFKRRRDKHVDFTWNITIDHNNMQLRRILERGISENHFHLFGSAPYFHLMWIYFMNHVSSGILSDFSKEAEKTQRATREHYNIKYSEDSFAVRILKAALIRVYIVYGLLEMKQEEFSKAQIDMLLTGEMDIGIYHYQIQTMIDHVKEFALLKGFDELLDYALYDVSNLKKSKPEMYWFAGERWMMYRVLVDELSDRKLPKKYYQLFYAYLVMKQSVRSELVQVNHALGFENFQIYNSRKGVYTDSRKMIESAVYGSMESGNIQCLEIRVSPKDCAEKNAEMILGIDSVLKQRVNPISKKNYYYVFHFAKRKDEDLPDEECFDGCYCRHYTRRKVLEGQANALYDFRERFRKAASNVLGIDACAQEIGCRPEVFAVVFRFLAEHVTEEVVGAEKVPQLKMTYHVGEDFLDVVDGLRAVDEAIYFLNLQCGDRIGHGTVLGIDVKKWYALKQYTIVLPQQDYLDNVVWLYHKLIEYGLQKFDHLKEVLLREFDFYFSQVYGKNGARNSLVPNIHAYYEAWKLRGDEPELYINGQFGDEITYRQDWLINRKFPKEHKNRLREEVGFLYYLYHYNWRVRKEGEKSIQRYIPSMYVKGVEAVQKAMAKDFASRGIGVETNPSSNLAISTAENYDELPIVQLYNKDMTWDIGKLQSCPQINVSINTDDKGVFHTSLENEYALMACALEKVRDENENQVYDRQMIYQWIENIRQMGNLQSFKEKTCSRGE